jgi:uncharacterized membrane protein YqjE
VKGVGIEYLWQDATVLAVFGIITLLLATWRLRKALS